MRYGKELTVLSYNECSEGGFSCGLLFPIFGGWWKMGCDNVLRKAKEYLRFLFLNFYQEKLDF